jgi:hypothetical protein
MHLLQKGDTMNKVEAILPYDNYQNILLELFKKGFQSNKDYTLIWDNNGNKIKLTGLYQQSQAQLDIDIKNIRNQIGPSAFSFSFQMNQFNSTSIEKLLASSFEITSSKNDGTIYTINLEHSGNEMDAITELGKINLGSCLK